MRARQWFCCVAVLGICLVGSSSAQQGVQWQPTLDVAKRVAGRTGRLVLIHFWDDGCRPCQEMDRDVFSRADIAAAMNRDFVAVKVKRSHFPASASQYGVSAVPTDVIITPQGRMIERHTGAVGASEYMGRLIQMASNWRRASPSAGYARNPSSQGPASPSSSALPAYAVPRQVPGGVPPARPPAFTGAANGFAASANQHQMPAPPAMDARYRDRIGAAEQNQRLASRQPDPAASNLGREAFQPVESAYSPPLADNAGRSFRLEPAPSQYPPQQSPYMGPQSSTSATIGNFTPTDPQGQLAQRRSLPHGSSHQPAPINGPVIEIPPGNPAVALDGFCPVRLTENKQWVLGDRRWGLRHEGRTYLFAGPDEQRRFNEKPDEYAPVLSGNDVVLFVNGGQTAAGRRECGAWFMGRMFLFSDETSFQKFEADPDYYAAAIRESVSNVANRNAGPPVSGRPWNARN